MQDAFRDFTHVIAGLATLSELQLCAMQVGSFMAAMQVYNALQRLADTAVCKQHRHMQTMHASKQTLPCRGGDRAATTLLWSPCLCAVQYIIHCKQAFCSVFRR